jgi:hypothetical protein
VAVRVWVAAHRKLIVAVTGAALTLAIQVWGTGNPWVSLAILAATSLGVYGAPNQPPPPVRAEKTLITPAVTGTDPPAAAGPPV